MNRALLHNDVQEFLEGHYKEEVSKMAFKGSPFPEVTSQELGVQLIGKKKAEKKLPTWFAHRGIIYPPRINLEQTSSETTASYKASLIDGKSLIDITGGFGIDAYFFAKKFERVIHCELDPDLSEIVEHNTEVLEIPNLETYSVDGIGFLQNTSERFDWIYIDPSRRDDAGGRVFFLSDCLPNVPEYLDLLQKKADNILIKTSPLLDLQAGILELENVQEIHIVAVENDVKELLWILKKATSEAIKIKTLNFQQKGLQVYENFFRKSHFSDYSTPLAWLYEPNAAIMKSNLFEALGNDFELQKLHPNTHLYTSNHQIEFPGRRFRIHKVLPYNRKTVKSAIDFEKAHISIRNFPESVATIRKKLKIKDGGEYYLFFTTTLEEEKLVLVCQKG